jgi:hypothetical protein
MNLPFVGFGNTEKFKESLQKPDNHLRFDHNLISCLFFEVSKE